MWEYILKNEKVGWSQWHNYKMVCPGVTLYVCVSIIICRTSESSWWKQRSELETQQKIWLKQNEQ